MFTRSLRAKAVAHHQNHKISCTSLCCAQSGEKVCVTQLCGCETECAKLREIGVREGANITVLRHGSPLLVLIDGARFGIGQGAATNVLCDIVSAK